MANTRPFYPQLPLSPPAAPQEADSSGLDPETLALLNQLYPQPQQPQLQTSPNLRLGPLRVPGNAIDAAALAAANQMQYAPRPRNFGQGLAQGLVGGLAQSRASQAVGRSNANQSALDEYQKASDERRKAAATLAIARHGDVPADADVAKFYNIPEGKKIPLSAVEAARRQLQEKPSQQPTTMALDEAMAKRFRRKAGELVPASVYNQMLGIMNPNEGSAGPYVTVMTPQGPRYMPAKDAAAAGYPPSGLRQMRAATGTEREQLSGDLGLLAQVNRTKALYRKAFVGPMTGMIGGVRQKLGGNTKSEASFRANLSAIRNQILKLRSGGAVTPQEAQRLLEELPTASDPSESFLSKMDSFETTFRTLAESRRQILDASNVDVSRFPPLPPHGEWPTERDDSIDKELQKLQAPR